MTRPAILTLLIAAAALLPGCLERRVSITSDPSGALVTANDVELGRTPLQAGFTYYNAYDVRVEMDGYEPLRTKARANAPIYEYPPFDVPALAFPVDIHTTIHWHFKLEPELSTVQPKEELEKGLLERATSLRMELK